MKLYCRQCDKTVKRPFNLSYADKFCDEGHPLSHASAARPAKPRALRQTRKPRPSLASFHEAVIEGAGGACALEYLGGCQGRLWGHHYVGKRFLRGNEDAYKDPRNGVALCVDHHANVENARIVCPRPPYLDEFLAAYGLADPDERAEAA